MSDAANVLELYDVVRSYGTQRILRGVSARFTSGTVHGIVGPNGAGKSTLLKIISGALAFERGGIAFNDEVVRPDFDLSASIRRKIGWLGHKSFAYVDLTGRENLNLYADLWGIERGQVDHCLDRFGLVRAADKKAGSYSRGMMQRLAWARIWLQDPSFLLLDEPTTGLDAGMKAKMVDEIRAWGKKGRVVLWVTHDSRELDDLDATVHRLARGRFADQEVDA